MTAAGSIPIRVRATAIARGVITGEAAARLRDREAIKLIFKSGYHDAAETAPGETTHGTGMSLVRRYVHEAGRKDRARESARATKLASR